MITHLALTGVAIVVFLIPAELAWRLFQRRHIDRPLPVDPAARDPVTNEFVEKRYLAWPIGEQDGDDIPFIADPAPPQEPAS